ncbi:lysine N(6)-hydroxylase/L-ornithine N(5)-oxygenase family protein [Legionella sp. D16C41]|uniref:lysine N(6)-hydroxylase/L-ornithine N(5)-oxygenase family protein n=1 Tax=Legionella sp. D16C41 TaxID=3402688 RepID=UPI003AF94F54
MLYKKAEEIFDLIGVGIGPFNLSLAALLSPLKNIKSSFYDQNKSFLWHPGMLLPEAELQVNFLYDLVTLVDHTNPYSFIGFLAKHKRLYHFLNAQFKRLPRAEFSNYLQWVSQSLPNLFFAEKIEEVSFKKSLFKVLTQQRIIYTKNIVLGNGLIAKIPTFAKNYLNENVFHSKDFLFKLKNWHNKKIAIIGSGQSSAEIVYHLLSETSMVPKQLVWLSKREQLMPLDDTTFTNELFTPQYSDYFFKLAKEKQVKLLNQQASASDGISLHLLNKIYQQLYKLEFLEQKENFFKLIMNHRLSQLHCTNNYYQLVLTECGGTNQQFINADIIIFCTGYQWEFPEYLSLLTDRIPLKEGQFCFNNDFSIQWDGPKQNHIYAHNAARHQYGVAEPSLPLMAWRSAKIINSLCQAPIYELDSEANLFTNFSNRPLA